MDYVLGQDAIVPVEVRNVFTGAPVLGATIGAWSLYGPESTAALDTDTGATEVGGGVYYLGASSAYLTVPGVYRIVYAVSLPLAGIANNQTATFLVGPAPLRGAQRLRDLLVSIIRGVGGSVRPSTTINTTTVTDDYWSDSGAAAAIGAEDFSGSEIVVIDPSTAATYADWPHGRVVSFNATTGAFTLNRTTGLSSDSTKRMYALTNVQGTGFSFEQILGELQVAYDEVQPTFLGSVSAGVSVAEDTLEYVLPSYLTSVARVSTHQTGDRPADLWDNIDGRWELLRDRRTLRLDDGLGLGSGSELRVEGAIRCELPKLGGGWTDMPGVWLRERTRFGLFSASPNPTHQRAASVIYANLARMPNPHRVHIPGEQRL